MTAGRVSDQIRLFLGSTESLLVRRGPPRAGYRYHTVMGFSAARGRAFDPPADRLPDGVLPGVPGYCFSNAHNLVRADRRFLYAEGYAVRAGVPLPVAHGWALARRGLLKDMGRCEGCGCRYWVPTAVGRKLVGARK